MSFWSHPRKLIRLAVLDALQLAKQHDCPSQYELIRDLACGYRTIPFIEKFWHDWTSRPSTLLRSEYPRMRYHAADEVIEHMISRQILQLDNARCLQSIADDKTLEHIRDETEEDIQAEYRRRKRRVEKFYPGFEPIQLPRVQHEVLTIECDPWDSPLYQTAQKMISHMVDPHLYPGKPTMLQAETGMGKSVLFKLLSLAQANAGRRILILCHSNAAVEDMVKALSHVRDERYPELVIEHFAGLSSYHRQAYIEAQKAETDRQRLLYPVDLHCERQWEPPSPDLAILEGIKKPILSGFPCFSPQVSTPHCQHLLTCKLISHQKQALQADILVANYWSYFLTKLNVPIELDDGDGPFFQPGVVTLSHLAPFAWKISLFITDSVDSLSWG